MNWIKRLIGHFSFGFFTGGPAVSERTELHAALDLIARYIAESGGVANVMRAFEGRGFAGKVRSWAGDGPALPLNAVEALQLIGWKNLNEMSERAGIPADRLRDLLAQALPMAIRRASPGRRTGGGKPPA